MSARCITASSPLTRPVRSHLRATSYRVYRRETSHLHLLSNHRMLCPTCDVPSCSNSLKSLFSVPVLIPLSFYFRTVNERGISLNPFCRNHVLRKLNELFRKCSGEILVSLCTLLEHSYYSSYLISSRVFYLTTCYDPRSSRKSAIVMSTALRAGSLPGRTVTKGTTSSEDPLEFASNERPRGHKCRPGRKYKEDEKVRCLAGLSREPAIISSDREMIRSEKT